MLRSLGPLRGHACCAATSCTSQRALIVRVVHVVQARGFSGTPGIRRQGLGSELLKRGAATPSHEHAGRLKRSFMQLSECIVASWACWMHEP